MSLNEPLEQLCKRQPNEICAFLNREERRDSDGSRVDDMLGRRRKERPSRMYEFSNGGNECSCIDV